MGKKLPEDWILARSLRSLEVYLVKSGLDWTEVAEKFGLDPSVGHQRRATIPIKTFLALREYSADITGNDALSFYLGSTAPIGFASTRDYIAISAPSLRVGMQNWARYNPMLSNAFTLSYTEQDGIGYLEWIIPDRLGPRTQFLFSNMSWAAMRILYIIGDPAARISLEFSCQEPKSSTDFQNDMGQRIRYNQKHDRILIPGKYLSLSHDTAEPNLYSMIEQAAISELQEREQSDDELITISEYIGEALKTGDNSLENIASSTGMSPRTLQRKLAASGTNFRDLTNEIRKAMAMRYLTDTNLRLSEIAFLLGFSDLSAFSRSARSWFGVAPREYRRRQR